MDDRNMTRPTRQELLESLIDCEAALRKMLPDETSGSGSGVAMLMHVHRVCERARVLIADEKEAAEVNHEL